ncbi:MAG: DUF3696 domain-containing protein [Chloroflexi bacterium]|nr:DUF3696 domain-containing protein [Chloroflexota bacterium]
MLTGIGLRNFKAFGDEMQEAPLSKITLIYGPNSGGKSSIIQALLLLKQSHEGHYNQGAMELIPRGRYADLGSFPSLIHKHDIDLELGIKVEFDAEERALTRSLPIPTRRNRSFRFRKRFTEGLSGCVDLIFVAEPSDDSDSKDSSELSSVGYRLTHDYNEGMALDIQLELERNFAEPSDNGDSLETPKFNWQNSDSIDSFAKFAAENLTSLIRHDRDDVAQNSMTRAEWSSLLENSSVETALYAYGLPYTIRPFIETGTFTPRSNRLTIPLMADYRYNMDRITYLGPLRSYPERLYTVSGGGRESTGIRGEFTPHILHYNPSNVVGSVNEWFKKFRISYELDTSPLGSPELAGEHITIALKDEHTKTRVTLADVGFGINQLLPVIIEGIASPEDSIICVEQPEIHIHPRLQAHLADLMIDTIADEPVKRKQWIVETHSELLILRLQRRIREGEINSEDVSVLYVNPGQNGSTIEVLRLDEEGDFIDAWPHGFFDEGFNELMDA